MKPAERLAEVKRRQQAGPTPTMAEFAEAFERQLAEHQDHRWRQVSRCVYCECGVRLYQGTVPEGHPTFTPPKKPTAADEMRRRWNKD